MLADDPAAVLAALTRARHDGAEAADLGRALAYAAALRVARFAPSNEHGDWETAHHVFTYANAVHQALKRLPPAVGRRREVLRAVFHGAMAVYLARYLNVPPARLPGENGEAGWTICQRNQWRCRRPCSTASTAGTRSSWRHGWSPVIFGSAIRQTC